MSFSSLRKPVLILVAVLVLSAIMTACSPLAWILPARSEQSESPAGPVVSEGEGEVYQEDVVVESVEVLMLESFPVQVQLEVRGLLPDACSFVDMVEQSYGENLFEVTLHNARYPNMRCAPQPTPFEMSVMLDVLGLEAGDYTVLVHGVEATFNLPVDNIPVEE